MMQTLALLNDSLRLLRSRYLFWISLAISVVIAIALFGVINFTDDGWRILWFDTIESDTIRAGSPETQEFMAFLFNLFVFWWLSWGAIILAVVSTSGILPDFLAGGAIEVTLAKPISRLKLFLLKVVGALLFVALQVGLSVGIAYVLMGVKADIWLPAALWAIPLITLQFLFLYSVSALVAVLTRSTLACLIATLLFYLVISGLQLASNQIDRQVGEATAHLQMLDDRIESIRVAAEREGRDLLPHERTRIRGAETAGTFSRQMLNALEPWQKPVNTLELVIPKTGDVRKMVANLAEAPLLNEFVRLFGTFSQPMGGAGLTDQEWNDALAAGTKGQEAGRSVNMVTSLGTSLAFTALVLAAATVFFWRRDF